MEEYHEKATDLNLNRGFATIDSKASGTSKDEFAVLQDKQRKN